jgi:hypothetical protein
MRAAEAAAEHAYLAIKAQGKLEAPADSLDVWDAGADSDPIEPRAWLLGNIFCRGFVSSLVASGGVGKTAVRIAQALALATGYALTGEHVFSRSRVLIISLEDDRDELRRRIRAAMRHHKMTESEVSGYLFCAAAGTKGWKLATMQDGKIVASTLGPLIVDQIKKHSIDVVMLDPFVKSHSVEENANGAIDFVTNILASIAIEHRCAVDVPHHVSKGAADAGNADRGRGASSFKDAARLVYTLTPMSEDEGKAFNLSEVERRALIRMDSGKVNIAPHAGAAKWFRLVGVNIGNATPLYPKGDEVQTVEPWSPPDTWSGLSTLTLNAALSEIDEGLPDGQRYSDAGAAKALAAWRIVQKHVSDKSEPQCREIVKTWVKSGVLEPREYHNPIRREPGMGLWLNHAKRPS